MLWKPSETANPADAEWPDIEQFRIMRVWPDPEWKWRIVSPVEWAKALLKIRTWKGDRLDRELFGDRSN